MNVLVVDTSSWISFFEGRENDDLDLALKEGRVYLSPVVAAELLSGGRTQRERDDLKEFLKELPLCDASLEHWMRVGELRQELMQKGFILSTPDAHVAQCALDLKGYLMTEDQIFSKISKVIEDLRLIS